MPNEYKNQEEALDAVASILKIPKESITKQNTNLFEGFEKPRWLDVYYVPENSFGINRVGVGYCRHGYCDGYPRPMFGLWSINEGNNLKRF